MTDLLDHAITVRDLLYVCAALTALFISLMVIAALYLKRGDRRREALARQMRAEREADGTYGHLRNPAYGTPPKPGIRWSDGRPYVADVADDKRSA
jgi:hypothetical protein